MPGVGHFSATTAITDDWRAAILARGADDEDVGETIRLVVLRVGAERYGVDIEYVRETTPMQPLTPLPATPVFWLGLVNLTVTLL